MRAAYRFSAILLAVLALSSCSDEAEPPAAQVPAATPVPATPAVPAPASAPAAPAAAVFSPAELDQMLAPLALYPDALLAQVLMAATYPGDVADAVVWSKAHPDSSGDAAVLQVANQPWDPSVQSLVAFPAALAILGQDAAWVQRVGDAFLAQPDAVMASVQRLRRQAQAAGHLESNEQQRVTVQPAAPAAPAASGSTTVVQQPAATQTIIIAPAQPQTVYVPSYNPSVVYGSWVYPSYPPVYYPPPPGYYIGNALVAGLAFGVGVAVVNSLWGDCDWGHGDIDIDIDRYNRINVNRQLNVNQNTWRHNSINRDGVPYRDRVNRQQGGRRLSGSVQREAFRGFDPARTVERDRARQALTRHGIDAPATSNRQARERAQTASRELGSEGQLRERARSSAEKHLPAQNNVQNNAQLRERAQARVEQRQPLANNSQVRERVRVQHARTQGLSNNAFAGTRSPALSRAQVSRGEASRLAASRPQTERGEGRAVQRAPRLGERRN